MITPMTKIQLGIPLQQKDAVLQFLQEEEVLHVIGEAAHASETDTAYRLAQVQFGLEFIARLRTRLNAYPKRSLRLLFAPRPAAKIEQLEEQLASTEHEELLSRMQLASDTLTSLDSQFEDVSKRIETLKPWRGLALSGSDDAPIDNIKHLLLAITTHNEALIHERIVGIPTAVWQEVQRTQEGKQITIYGELVVHTNDADDLAALLALPGIQHITLELGPDMTIASRLEKLNEERQTVQQHIDDLLASAREFFSHEQSLQFAYDALLHRQEREDLESKITGLQYTAVLTAWLPKKWLARFTKRLAKQFPQAAVVEIETTEDDIPPVALMNRAAIRPFEAVTNIYGKPAYNELDPSGALAIFFLVSFGLALTDAGYGLVMMALMFVAEKFFRLKREMRKMVRLLFYAGVSTTILGALTGGWFGVSLEALPPSGLRDLLLSWKVIDPISNPIGLLMFAFAIGIVQLLTAWGVRGYHNWKTGNSSAIFLDDIPWITMVAFILLWVGANNGIIFAGAAGVLKWAAIANAVFLVLTQGRSAKNPFLKLGSGILSLYGLVSFLSDVLSYSRLLALGLATGIIGLVVNLIAGMVNSSIPVVGFLLAGVVLLVGHTFNLGINALGAFIHSGRLQFVEFFPKFMEGGGTPYTPFGRVSRYVDNPSEFK